MGNTQNFEYSFFMNRREVRMAGDAILKKVIGINRDRGVDRYMYVCQTNYSNPGGLTKQG